MRKKIYQMVHLYDYNMLSVFYKWFMIVVIALSLIPLTVKQTNDSFLVIDGICLVIYTADFALRWICADYKFNNSHWSAFVKYPFRLISLIDLMSVFALMCPLFGWFERLAFAEVLKAFRIIRIFRYSKSTRTIMDILKSSRKPLMAVGSLAIGYILISALIIFNVEPQTFRSFFEAVYWAIVSLTTVGYGDIYPVSVIGRTVAMLSSFFGIAIVALPAGIVTAGYMNSIKNKNEKE